MLNERTSDLSRLNIPKIFAASYHSPRISKAFRKVCRRSLRVQRKESDKILLDSHNSLRHYLTCFLTFIFGVLVACCLKLRIVDVHYLKGFLVKNI